MELILNILTGQILPIFAIAGVGWLLASQFKLEVKTLSQVAMNAFLPCLIFNTLVKTQVDFSQSVRTAIYGAASILGAGLLCYLLSRALRLSKSQTLGFMLVVMFTNVGSFGLSVISIAFGQEALAHGTVYFLVSNVLLYTLGIGLVSSSTPGFLITLKRLARMPILWGVALAALVGLFQIKIPSAVMNPIQVLSSGSVPLMLVVMGMQIHNGRIQARPLTWLAVGLRLAVIPLMLTPMLGVLALNPPAVQASVLQSAGPAGMATSMLAVDNEIEPDFVSSVVFISSILSAFTIPLIVFWFRG